MPEHDPTRTDRLALYMRARAAEQSAHDEAVAVVERWNAVLAGTPWLDVNCPGCRTSRAIDIRKLDRHPLASVGIDGLGPLLTA